MCSPVPSNGILSFCKRVDKSPMRANVAVFKRDMVGPRVAPPILSTAALVKILSLHHELGQPRNAVRYSVRFVRCQVIVCEADPFKIVAAMDIGQRHALASL